MTHDTHPCADRALPIPPAPILHPCPWSGFRAPEEEARGSFRIRSLRGRKDDSVRYADPDDRGGAGPERLDGARAPFQAARPHLRRQRMAGPTIRAGAPCPLHAHPFEAA